MVNLVTVTCEWCGNTVHKEKRRVTASLKAGTKMYCGNDCAVEGNRYAPKRVAAAKAKAVPAKERLFNSISYVLNTTDCWEWLKGQDKGYGAFYTGVGVKVTGAHRYMYELMRGAINDSKLFVCRTCDNHLCCRPSHLWLGTHEDNQRDKVEKERHLFGENAPTAKLVNGQVKEIREDAKKYTRKELAEKFGVSEATIRAIVTNKTWKKL